MYKLIAATLVALFAVFIIFGDESRRPEEVARSEMPALFDFDLSSWVAPVVDVEKPRSTSGISDAEAIEIAMEAGRAHREGRKIAPFLGALVAAVETPSEPDTLEKTMWYVTGSTVNVRAGPGTGNPVVTQVRFGEAAEVLGDPDDGWVQIKPAGGETIGWISARFLDPEAPG